MDFETLTILVYRQSTVYKDDRHLHQLLTDRLATFKRASRSRQSELSEPPVLWDNRSDHTNRPGDLASTLVDPRGSRSLIYSDILGY